MIPLVAVAVSTYLKVVCHHVISVTSLFQGHIIFRICTLTGAKERHARNLQRETQIKYTFVMQKYYLTIAPRARMGSESIDR